MREETSEMLSKSLEFLRIENEIPKEKWDRFIDVWNSIPLTPLTFTKEQLAAISNSVGTVEVDNSDTICREVRGKE